MGDAVRAVAGDVLVLERREVVRAGIAGTQVRVFRDGVPLLESGGPATADPGLAGGHEHPHRHESEPEQGHEHEHERDRAHHPFPGVIARIEQARLPDAVRDRALAAFHALGEAEARVHGVAPREVHFHEVGTLDAIADVVGAAAGLESLGLTTLHHGAVAVGGGRVRAGHGWVPVPAPATLELLRGRPCIFEPEAGELTTPTGAALLAAWASPLPAGWSFRPVAVGYGAGRQDPPGRANLARMTVGEADADAAPVRRGRVAVIEASVDDATPEAAGHLVPALLAEGALDATLTPLFMKKGRPGFLLRVLCPPEAASTMAERVVSLSPSLGARWRIEERLELPRREARVRLPAGEIRLKIATLPDGRERAHPESDDVSRAASASGRSFAEVAAEALRVWEDEPV
jgi:uncharacterized protein (TIGR00299 family) protein